MNRYTLYLSRRIGKDSSSWEVFYETDNLDKLALFTDAARLMRVAYYIIIRHV